MSSKPIVAGRKLDGSTPEPSGGASATNGQQADVDAKPNNTVDGAGNPGVPSTVTRQENDFYSTTNDKGSPKSYLDEDGNLVPSNPDADISTVSQVRGGAGNSGGSNLTSTTDPNVAVDSKSYGDQEISINTGQLQNDIDAGIVTGVEIRPPSQVRQDLQNNIDAAQARYDNNPTPANQERLNRAIGDYDNAVRDGECLISGCVPVNILQGLTRLETNIWK